MVQFRDAHLSHSAGHAKRAWRALSLRSKPPSSCGHPCCEIPVQRVIRQCRSVSYVVLTTYSTSIVYVSASELPPSSVTVRVTSWGPEEAKVYWAVRPVASVWPSPSKSHS